MKFTFEGKEVSYDEFERLSAKRKAKKLTLCPTHNEPGCYCDPRPGFFDKHN